MNISSRSQAYVPDEVLLKFKPNRSLSNSVQDQLQEFGEQHGAQLLKTYDLPPALLDSFEGELAHLKLPQGLTVEEAQALWSKDERVEYVASNDLIQVSQRDPIAAGKLNPKSWGLHNNGQTGGTAGADVSALEAWDTQVGKGPMNEGPIIAVLDTGIDLFHEALKPNLWTNPGEIAGDGLDNDGNGVIDDIHGFNPRQDGGFPLDDNGHGSHCAGIIAAADGNPEKISGVMKKSQLMGIKFLSKLGGGKLSDAIEGLLYADQHGARIVSNSWGGGPYNKALHDVLKASPALHIFAAGNEGNNDDINRTYPSAYDLPNIISVAATDHNDQLADFSNYGATTVDLAAPGVDIYSAFEGGEYRELDGTSMAAPFVAGAAGLLVSEYPEIDNRELKARILNSVDRLPQLEGKVASGGRLNLARALERDTLGPDKASDFSVGFSEPGRLQVSFRPSGDDGAQGQAAKFTLKVSDKPIVTSEPGSDQVLFEEATTLASGYPDAAGELQEMEIKTPQSGQAKQLYYALSLEDNVGNRSDIATSHTVRPASHAVYEPKDKTDKSTWNSVWEWGQVEESGRGLVWTDSPEGNYSNASSWMRSGDIALAGLKDSKLVFEAKYDLENERDYLKVQVGVPKRGGIVWEWRDVGEFRGTSEWGVHEIDLSKYDDEERIRLYLKMKPDGKRTQDGFYFDNLAVVGQPTSEAQKVV